MTGFLLYMLKLEFTCVSFLYVHILHGCMHVCKKCWRIKKKINTTNFVTSVLRVIMCVLYMINFISIVFTSNLWFGFDNRLYFSSLAVANN